MTETLVSLGFTQAKSDRSIFYGGYTEGDGSLALSGDALAAFLQRLESMLRAADLQGWAEAAASPPATEQQEDAASLIQFSARSWAARKQERFLQHGHAASVIQRRFKHFCASRVAAATPPAAYRKFQKRVLDKCANGALDHLALGKGR